jgi:hypothetical protein
MTTLIEQILRLRQTGASVDAMAEKIGASPFAVRDARDCFTVEAMRAGNTFQRAGEALNTHRARVCLDYHLARNRFAQRALPWRRRSIKDCGYFSPPLEDALVRKGLDTLGRIDAAPDDRLLKVDAVGPAKLARIRAVIEWERGQ